MWDRIKEFFARFTAEDSKKSAEKAAADAAAAASHEAAVRDSLKAVTEQFPDVLKKDSAFNTEFCALVRQLQAEQPDTFKTNGNWPMEIAQNIADAMAIEKSAAQGGLPQVGDASPKDTPGASDDPWSPHNIQQRALQRPLSELEPPVGPAMPHFHKLQPTEQMGYLDDYWRNNGGNPADGYYPPLGMYDGSPAYNQGYPYRYVPNYFSNRYYYTTPANQYQAGPGLTVAAQKFAGKVMRQYGVEPRVAPRTATPRSATPPRSSGNRTNNR